MKFRWDYRFFVLLGLVLFVFIFASCNNNENLINEQQEEEIDYKVMTSKKDSDEYFTKTYLGLKTGESFPVKAKYNMVFVCDGNEGLTNNLVVNLINLTYIKPITVIVTNRSEEETTSSLLQMLPKDSEILLLNEVNTSEYGLGYPPALYFVENDVVTRKYSRFLVQDWKNIEAFLLSSGEFSNFNPAELGDLFPILHLLNAKKELFTFDEPGSKILITLSPECSICMDTASWILKQNWPINPIIVINNRGEYLLDALSGIDSYYEEIEVSEESYESIKKGQFLYREKVTGLLNILSTDYKVYLADNTELGESLGVYQYPTLIVVDENDIIVERFCLMLVNSKFSTGGDYLEPIQIIKQVLKK